MENNDMIIAGKLRKTSTFNIPTVFTNEYLAKEHEFYIFDEFDKLDSGLVATATKIADDINDIGGASVEFEHISQIGFDNDKKKE